MNVSLAQDLSIYQLASSVQTPPQPLFLSAATLLSLLRSQKASTTSQVQSNYVQLEFRDTGIGIAENEIPKIFDRFYRVRSGATEDKGGAGLGLMIVQQLLGGCGGSISVKSKLREGSIFTVQLVVSG